MLLDVGCWQCRQFARGQELAKPAVLVVDSTGGIFIDLLASLGTTQVILVPWEIYNMKYTVY